MPLKASLASKAEFDALPEAVRALYKEDAGKYALDVDGMVTDDMLASVNTKLGEFRDNNIKLKKDLEKFKDIDPKEYERLKAAEQKLKDKGADLSDLELQIAKAVEKATGPLNTKVETFQKERDDARAELESKSLQDALWAVGVKAGVREEAKGFWLSEASKQFKRDGEALVAFKGDAPVFSKRKGAATDPMTADEWALEIAPLDPALGLLYKGSSGSNAKPNGQGGGETRNGVRVLPNDMAVTSQNLEAIASGKAVVHHAA